MKNFLKPVKQDQKKSAQTLPGEQEEVKEAPGCSTEQAGEFLTLKFMRGLIIIQINRLTPLSFFTTLLFMVFVIIMMKHCSTVLVAFLQSMTKLYSVFK